MSVLGLDTSTAATAVCVLHDGRAFEHTPRPADLLGRPRHGEELMPAVHRSMAGAGIDFEDLDAIAVGVGPGAYTGLRIGVATARALGHAAGVPLRPVATPAALAANVDDRPALALLDARRGEVFASLWDGGEARWPVFTCAPDELARRVESGLPTDISKPLAIGDGALRSRHALEAVGIEVPPDESLLHVVRAVHICGLAAGAPALPPAAVTPDYMRDPDAKPSR